MFDNPKKELERLEEQLLAAEQPDDDFEQFYEAIYDEFGPEEPREEYYPQEPLEEYGPQEGVYGEYEEEPPYERPLTREEKIRRYNSCGTDFDAEDWEEAPPVKEKGIRGLVITACCLSAGIVGIAIWWLVRFL